MPLTEFNADRFAVVDQETVDRMCAESARWGRAPVRRCLHGSPESPWHEMIILEREGHYFPPHRHYRKKSETLHIIEGRLGVVQFDDAGNVRASIVLERDGAMMARVAPDVWHMTVALSDPVIYHESKPGPFAGDLDRAFATWAPLREDTEGAMRYLEAIVQGLGE
jgi:cupin fold WbuC family metalloprotein